MGEGVHFDPHEKHYIRRVAPVQPNLGHGYTMQTNLNIESRTAKNVRCAPIQYVVLCCAYKVF